MLDMTRHYLFDGGMGTMLQERGLPAGGKPELFNLEHPDVVREVHRAYVEAGSDIITTNTFGASRHKLGCDPAPYIRQAVALAREAGAPLVALDIGPIGAMLQPMGTMSFDEAYDLFAEQVKIGAEAGADLVLIETMSDLLEAKAALLAAKEHSALPVFVTMTFGEEGRTFLGTEPKTAAVTLTSLGADAVGINCSLGPEALVPMVREMLRYTHLPIIVQPNAGIPRLERGKTVFDVGPEEFARYAEIFLDAGVAILGGCCGTTSAHILAIKEKMAGRRPILRERDTAVCRLCGWQSVVELRQDTIATVGERINPTGRRLLKEALYKKDYTYAAELAIAQEGEGADFLVVNAGLPDIDEREALPALVQAVQRVSPLPVVIDCSDPAALEKALRIYSGRPVLNSVNGDPDSLRAMLPLAAKYGTAIVALALDDQGISNDPAERFAVAQRIVTAGAEQGIPKEDFLIDCLTMAASVSQDEVMATVEAVRLCRQNGLKTILGVSNISHGLPNRQGLNCAFLSAALAAGLNIGIVNTSSAAVMETIAAMRVLLGQDRSAAAYIAQYSGAVYADGPQQGNTLEQLILTGVKSEVPAATETLLQQETPLEVINSHIIPALDIVGERYEAGTMFLPQLMSAAEAVKSAFSVINRYLPEGAGEKGTIILATVKGDIHDIGKNIAKMLLENYGYRIVDLGRDVTPEAVVEAALREKAPLVGLSSLMTTTAQNIAVTIKALKQAGAACKIMVGGAVVTKEFAAQIGADFYAKDATESARYAAQVFGNME